jgi:predicted outer membrane repeat protein
MLKIVRRGGCPRATLPRGRRGFRPALLQLEDRCVPSTVTNLLDSGAGSLRDALSVTPSGGTIGFAPGLAGTIQLASTLATANSVTVVGNTDATGAPTITVRGTRDTGGTFGDFYFSGPGATVEIDNLVITNGNAGGSGAGQYGGGINAKGTLTLVNDQVVSNAASGGGGGIDAYGSAGSVLLIFSSVISNNSTAGGFGGGVSTVDSVDIERSTFANNSGNYGGGAIEYSQSGANTNLAFYLVSTVFRGNTAETGGAVYSYLDITAGAFSMTVNGCVFDSNQASGADQINSNGGGMDLYHQTSGTASATVMMTNSTFFANSSLGLGGGLEVATYNSGSGTNTATLISETVAYNTAGLDGGGLYLDSSGANAGTTADNSIFAYNSIVLDVGVSLNEDLSGAVTSAGYNIISTTLGSSGWVATDQQDVDPLLASSLTQRTARDGSTTYVLVLLTGSPALNNGDPTLAGYRGFPGQDQLGNFRQAGSVSVGAYDPNAM